MDFRIGKPNASKDAESLSKGPAVRPGDSFGKTTRGSETSQYPEEKKSKEIPLVVASERGIAQTAGTCPCGVAGLIRFRTEELQTGG